VARYGHAADLFFTRRAHVNHVHLRTSSSTCAREVLRANVKFKTRWLRWNHFEDGRGFKKISSREPRIEGRRVAGQIICSAEKVTCLLTNWTNTIVRACHLSPASLTVGWCSFCTAQGIEGTLVWNKWPWYSTTTKGRDDEDNIYVRQDERKNTIESSNLMRLWFACDVWCYIG